MSDLAPPGPAGERCPACGRGRIVNRLDLGPQPLCNRFPERRDAEEYAHRLVLGQCGNCGLVRNLTPAPADQMRPRDAWISYREPEGHLDALAEAIRRLPGIGESSVFCGLTRQDDSTLRRLRERGCANTWRLDPAADLGIAAANAGIETIQERLTATAAARVAHARPAPDVVVARYALEHAHDAAGFLAALRRLAPAARLVFEVPDCARAFRAGDYSAIWEEHTLYFTPATLAGFFDAAGEAAATSVYPYPFQDALIAVAHPAAPAPQAVDVAAETRLFGSFVDALPARRARLREHLAAVRHTEGSIALLGAGHAACSFINLLGIGDLLSFVVDDNPEKAGRFMPGSRLPIRPSGALVAEGVRLCLLAVGDDAEGRVLAANRGFVEAGGRFASIFPFSRQALAP